MSIPEVASPTVGSPRKPILTRGQCIWSAACVALPLALGLFVHAAKPHYVSLLVQHPAGVRMLVAAFANLAFGVGIQALLFVALNQLLPPAGATTRRRHGWLALVVAAISFVLFVAPALFVVLVGPAAISIQEELLKDL